MSPEKNPRVRVRGPVASSQLDSLEVLCSVRPPPCLGLVSPGTLEGPGAALLPQASLEVSIGVWGLSPLLSFYFPSSSGL